MQVDDNDEMVEIDYVLFDEMVETVEMDDKY